MWKNLKLGTKIIISVFFLVVCLLTLILYDFLGLVDEGIQEQMRARIDEASAVGNLIIQNRLEELRVIALAVSEDNAVRLSISIGSFQAKLSHYLKETTLQAHIDFLTITDRTGIVYARVNNPDQYGDSLHSDPFVRYSLDRMSAWGIEKVPFSQLEKENLLPKLGRQNTSIISALALKVTVPVYDKLRYHLLGTVTAGDLLSGNTLLINKMKEILGKECEVVIYEISMNQEGIPIASSLEKGSGVAPLSPAAREAVLSGETDFYGEETLGGKTFFVSVQPLQDRAGRIVGALKIGLVREPFLVMQRAVIGHMLIFSGAGLILLFGLIMLVTRKITAPVKGLIRGMGTIEEGNLDFRMEIQSGDEVGQLTASFNQMAARLKKDEAEIKSYSQNLEKIVTERTWQLAESEERFRDVSASTGDWIWEIDTEGRYTYSSDALLQLLGYTPEEVLGKRYYDFFSPEDLETVKAGAEEVIAAHETFLDFENRLVHKDGRMVIVETSGFPVFNATGNYTGYRGVDRDITERKSAAEEKEYNFRLQETLGQVSALFITAQDLDEAITRSLGRTGEEIDASRAYLFSIHDNGRKMDNTHEWVAEGVSPQIRDLQNIESSAAPWWMEQLRKNKIIEAFDVGTLPEAERKILEPQGIVSILVIPIFIGGKLEGFLGFDETRRKRHWSPPEITVLRTLAEIVSRAIERKRAEETLRESEERFRTIFASAQDSIFIKDRSLKYTQVNAAMERLFNLPASKLIGRKDESLFGKEVAIHTTEVDLRVLGGEIVEEEYTKPVLGNPKIFHIIKVPMRSNSGEIIGLCGIARDVTELRKIERASHLTALGEMVAEVAHEINNPLMVIAGHSELLMADQKCRDDVKNSLREVHEQCFRAKKIIGDLLRFSKPSQGEIEPTAINQALDQVVKLIEHQLSLKNIKIIKNYHPDLPIIRMDEKQIQEVFLNLLTNSGQAMPDGGLITITTSCDNDYIRIAISDTGHGISQENLKKIFEPFFTTREDGTGLGLSVSHGIVKAHGGELTYSSQPGKKTTATIKLPLSGKKSRD